MSDKPRIIILGAGSRGTGYANFVARFTERAEIVAVAEPREFYRNRIGDEHQIPDERRFLSWTEVAARPRFADAVLICMQDDMHEEPAIAFARLGYHILLEKPMAPTAEACQRIVAEVKAAKVIFAVCHVLRYTVFTKKIKEILNAKTIGDIVSIQHLEPVGHWHQAHSFVRGNWRNEKESSCMLLAKCCHDLDWLRYVMDKPCRKVQSFGSLMHFRAECQPAGAADNCLDCPSEIEKQCPYSAIKIYLRDRIEKGIVGWPVDVLTTDQTVEGVTKALRTGPYGRCVYKCDNDVVDQQIVNLQFEDGSTAAMTMTAFCNEGGRQTRVFGTRGALWADSKNIVVTDFLTGESKTIDTDIINDGGILSGHGGGDGGIMDAFLNAVATGDKSQILSGIDETLESHLMVFAAENSRRSGQVQSLH